MYLEVIECLHQVNRSIYGFPGIVAFIAANVADIILTIYGDLLFPRDYVDDSYLVVSVTWLLKRTVNVLTLYMIGDATEKEVFILYYIIYYLNLL